MVRLKDRVALITGAAHGIGRGIALGYASEGAKIVVCDLDRDPSIGHAEEVAKLISEAGGEVEVFLGDASDTADMQRVVAATVERFGRRRHPGQQRQPRPTATRTTRANSWSTSEDQLYQGYFLPVQGSVPQHPAGGEADDRAGRRRRRHHHHLGAPGPRLGLGLGVRLDEGGAQRLVMSQARELAPHKIRVNAIAPGFIDNRLFAGERGERYDDLQHPRRDRDPARPGKPSDIAGRGASTWPRTTPATSPAPSILVDGGMLLPPITEI